MYYASWNQYLSKASIDIDRDVKRFKSQCYSVPSFSSCENLPGTKMTVPSSSCQPFEPLPRTLDVSIPPEQLEMIPEPQEPTFTLFAQLPTELRLQIWEHYHDLAAPQILDFRLCPADADHNSHKRKPCFAYPHLLALKARSIPDILHICLESREIGLKHYKLGYDIEQFPSETEDETTKCCHQHPAQPKTLVRSWSVQTGLYNRGRRERNIYYTPHNSILYLTPGWSPTPTLLSAYGGSSSLSLEYIRTLAVDRRGFWKLCNTTSGIVSFPELKMIFVLGQWGQGREGGKELGSVEKERNLQRSRVVWGFKVRRWCDRMGMGKGEKVMVRLVEDWGEVMGHMGSYQDGDM